MCADVFTTPKIVSSSDSEVCGSVNDSVKIHCSFNAAQWMELQLLCG